MGINKRLPTRFKAKRILPRAWGGFLLLPLLLSGCLAKRGDYSVPDVPLPGQYRNSLSEPAKATPAKGATNGNGDPTAPEVTPDPPPPPLPSDAGVGLTEWWHSFGSEELEGLIDRGMANNADIRMATLRIVQAKARADQAGVGRLPSISMPLVAATQYPASGSTVGTAPTASNGAGGSGGNTTQNTLQAYLRGDYRLDIWGEQSALIESAGLQLWRAAYERDNVKRNMAAALASYYLEYVALNDRLRVAKETESVMSSTLAAIEKRVAAGDATLTELEQQRAAIYSLRAGIPSMEQQREDDINSIAFLVGTVPSGLILSEDGLDSLALPRVVPGLPSSLLLRRPDVRMAEARMLSADADLDVARARILPPVDLSAQVGYSSLTLSQLFLPQALFWNTVANLTVNIFDDNKRVNEKVLNQAVKEEMVENYVRTLYQAMREVETALATIRLAEKRIAAQKETIAAARRAWDISTKVYAVGGIDYLTLLETERSYHRYLDEYQRIRMDFYRGYVSLFQALGGGVAPGDKLPGKGKRPTATSDATPIVAGADKTPRNNGAGEGIGWGDGRSFLVENFWQVEITGLYDRATIGSVWRDLRTRYPEWMEGRILRPRLQGRIDDNEEGPESWYRLYVAKFDSPGLAAGFCATLNASQQRCRVVSSRSDDTVVVAPADIRMIDIPSKPAKPAPTVAELTPPTLEGENKSVEPVDPSPVATVVAGGDAAAPSSDIPRDVTPRRPSKPARKKKGQKAGVTPKVDAVALHETKERLAYAIQLGAFANRENAALSQTFWKQKGYDVYASENRDAGQRPLYVVRTGIFNQRRDATAQAQTIRRAEMMEALVVPMMVDKQGKPSVIELGDPATVDVSTMPPAVPELPEAPDAPTTSSTPATPAAASDDVPPAVVSAAKLPAGTPEKPAEKTPATAPAKGAKARQTVVYALQLGAFSSLDNARVAFSFWTDKGYAPFISDIRDVEGRRWFAVRTGRYTQRREALTAALAFGKGEGVPVTVVPLRETADNMVPLVSDSSAAASATSPASAPQPAAQTVSQPASQSAVAEPPKVGTPTKDVVAPVPSPVPPPPPLPAESAADQPQAQAAPPVEEAPAIRLVGENGLPAGASAAPQTTEMDSDASPVRHGAYTVQLAAFASPTNAARALAQWERRGYPVYVARLNDVQGNVRYALRTGSFGTSKAGLAVLNKLDRKSRRLARLTPVGIEDADRMSREELTELN
jgi:NodT family efflux transporter outer membrane factor (OMF) lipoprotein